MDAHANFAFGAVATAPSPASSGVTLSLEAGQGALMPAVPFNATVFPAAQQPLSTNAEIVRVTATSGDNVTAMTRTAEPGGTTRAIQVGDRFMASITAKTLKDVEEALAAAEAASVHLTGNQTVAGVKTFSSPPIVPFPDTATAVANKEYVDATINGLTPHANVLRATTAALPASTYLAGVITGTALGALSIDGVAGVVGKPYLVKNETLPARNGIYTLTAAGGVAEAFVLTRRADMDEGSEVASSYTFVEAGSLEGTGWFTPGTAVTLGTTPIAWSQLPGVGDYVAGSGIAITGNSIAVSSSVVSSSGLAINVKQNGAKGDGVTDDTAALKAIAKLAAEGSLTVYFPRGIYLVNTESGPIFSQPANVQISLEGQGSGNVGSEHQTSQDHGVRIVRTAGTEPIFKAEGTSTSARCHGKIRGIEFNGNNLNGPVLEIIRGNEWLLDDVRVMNCKQTGAKFTNHQNSAFRNCYFYECGEGEAHPAVVFDTVTGSTGAAQTVQFTSCQWEHNFGTDLEITGSSEANAQTLEFAACKWERQVENATYPVFNFERAGRITFASCDISASGVGTSSRLFEVGPNMPSGVGAVILSGCNLSHPTHECDYYINLQSGILIVAGCHLTDAPSLNYMRIGSVVGLEAVRLAGNNYAAAGNVMKDNRVGSTGPDEYIKLNRMGLIGTAADGSIGIFGTIDLPDAVTSGVEFGGRLPALLRSSQSLRVRITYTTTVAGGNVCWKVKALGTNNETNLKTSGGVEALSTVAAPAQYVQTFTELTPGMTVNPGGMLGVQIERLGADAADTNTGVVQIVSVDFVGQARL